MRVLAVTFLAGVVFLAVIAAPAQTLQGIPVNNANAPFLQGSNGYLYGTQVSGGSQNKGTIFQVAMDTLNVTILYNFCSQVDSVGVCTDGNAPLAGVTQDSEGNLYGTTAYGGNDTNGGSVFKLTPGGVLTTLHSFCSETFCADGSYPQSGLVAGTDGNLYGTTTSGGEYSSGTVFKITPTGDLTTLYSFCGPGLCPNEAGETVTLVRGADGDFYGTTDWGGAHAGSMGGGMVFKISPEGTFNTLYSFCALTNCADGNAPNAALVQGTDGNFYGTTGAGGMGSGCANNTGCGTIFKITPQGALTTLYSFCPAGNCSEGSGYASSGVVQGNDGNFYGTASGLIFEITAAGAYTVVNGCCVGTGPLIQGSDGFFYGAAFRWSRYVQLAPTFTPTSVNFFNEAIDTTSTRSFLVKNVNTGNATVDFSKFTAAPPFAISANTCGTTLRAGSTCKVTVTFTPTVLGAVSGAVSIADNAPGTPQMVPLSGTGVTQVSLLPSTLYFRTVAVGVTSAAKSVILRNRLPTTLTGISYSIKGPFGVSSTTCSTTLPAHTGCTINLTFTPTAKGLASGSLTVSDSANNSPQVVTLSGTGD